MSDANIGLLEELQELTGAEYLSDLQRIRYDLKHSLFMDIRHLTID